MSNGVLLPYRVQKLNEIGFRWTIDKIEVRVPWEAMVDRLVEYKNEYGDTNVPLRYVKDEKLGMWVYTQIHQRRNGWKVLTPERIKKLDGIGFDWNNTIAADDKWDEKYDRLVGYWKENSSSAVPQRYDEDQELANWVTTQRNLYNTNSSRMTPERIERLDSIGFVWNAREAVWFEMYNRLVDYREENGHSDFPTTSKIDPKLGTWVDAQRQHYKKGKLSPDRIEMLEAVGFKWSVRHGRARRSE
mmetsp:Transcript_39596/g.95648  ORF Transcript_39596/g.95648 Transcript_39596/m.95648 type:complete len:245 (+) Transcript_39596:102-836(+)